MMTKKILPYFPEHTIYVEPFGGGASMLFVKEPSPVEVYNDLDSGLYNFFTVLSDPELFKQFHRRVQPLMYSRELYITCRERWREQTDPVLKAVDWFVVVRMSFSGLFGISWSLAVTSSNNNMADSCSKWLSAIDRLPDIHSRLNRVQIEHNDFRKVFETYDTPETFFYCDPPYAPSTRKDNKYECEMTDDHHEDLLNLLKNIKGMAILSGYNSALYDSLGWQRLDFETSCFAAGRTRASGIQGNGSALSKQARTESLWIHPRIREREPDLLDLME